MKRYYNTIIKACDKRVEKMLRHQIKDPSSKEYGAVYIKKEYTEPKSTIYRVTTAIAVYFNKDSKYFKDETLFNSINIALDYAKKSIHADGTYDLLDCNFNSAPDTAFCVKRLIPAYRIIEKYGFDENCNALKAKLLEMIKLTTVGMQKGGFHTPNHRWAIASILSCCKNVLGDETIQKDIDQYLLEGIDCNEDGEYAERSAATYNIVNNAAMISLYEELGQQIYLDYACKNLEMMLYYFEPDGSIFTDNSTRQDKGKKHYPVDYFYQYLFAAYKTKNPIFEAAAHKIISEVDECGEHRAPDCLHLLMTNDYLLDFELKEFGFPTKYNKYFKGSGLARIGNEKYSCSILRDSTKNLVFHAGKTQISMKIGMSYFDQRNFKAQTIEKDGDSFVLKFHADGWYYLPFKEKPNTSDWWEMSNENREKVLKNELNIVAKITPFEEGVKFHIKADGCENVLVRFEITLPATSYIENEGMFLESTEGHAIIIKQGITTINNGLDKIEVGPGFATHKFINGKFGSEERSPYHQTIYFTHTTGFEKEIFFRVV